MTGVEKQSFQLIVGDDLEVFQGDDREKHAVGDETQEPYLRRREKHAGQDRMKQVEGDERVLGPPGKMDEERQGQKIHADLQIRFDPADGKIGGRLAFPEPVIELEAEVVQENEGPYEEDPADGEPDPESVAAGHDGDGQDRQKQPPDLDDPPDANEKLFFPQGTIRQPDSSFPLG